MNRIPRLWRLAKLPYHYALAAVGALYYRFPAKKIFLIGISLFLRLFAEKPVLMVKIPRGF